MQASIASRIKLEQKWPENHPFVKGCKRRFSNDQFKQLFEQGYIEIGFDNQRSLLLTLRARPNVYDQYEDLEEIDFRIEALDFPNRDLTVIGLCDFTVIPWSHARARRNIYSFPSYERNLSAIIWNKCRFGIPKIEDFSRNPPDYAENTALWIQNGYRKHDNTGFNGLAELLFGSAVIIAKGLDVKTFYVRVGLCWDKMEDPALYDRNLHYYEDHFGVMIIDPEYGDSELDLRS